MILNEFGKDIGVERTMINEGDDGALLEDWVGWLMGVFVAL